MEEDPGVLGKLPRSRPGMRSAKRDGSTRPAKGPARAAQAAEARGTKAARPPKAARPAPQQTPRPRSRPAPTPPPPPPASGGPDPLGDVVRTGVKVAGAGVKVAGGVTRGLLRRLPRP